MVFIYLGLSFIVFSLALIKVSLNRNYGYLPIFLSLYFLFILIYPAFYHVANNSFPFYNMSYTESQQIDAALILLVFSIFFWFGFFINNKKINKKYIVQKKIKLLKYYSSLFVLLAILTIAVFSYGLETFMVKRGDFSREIFGDNLTYTELILTLIRSTSFAIVFFLLAFKDDGNKILWWVFLLYSFILFLIINFPLSLPRFVFFSYIISLFCLYFKPYFKNKILLILVFSISLTTLFPYFSYITRGGDDDFLIIMKNYYQSSGDFDGFQSIINTSQFVSNNGNTYGSQLISSLLSFVPRSIWSAKSDPTGNITAEAAGYSFLNISAPLPAELFIDFGYLGLLIFSFILGYFFRNFDKYYVHGDKSKYVYYFSIYLIAFVCIISRGSLLGVINNFYASVLIFFMIFFVNFYKIKF